MIEKTIKRTENMLKVTALIYDKKQCGMASPKTFYIFNNCHNRSENNILKRVREAHETDSMTILQLLSWEVVTLELSMDFWDFAKVANVVERKANKEVSL